MSEAPRIALLATGGTISAVADARSGEGGADAEALAGLVDAAKLCPVDVARVSSRAMTPELMRRLAASIQAVIDDGCDGVVVTHGTDTIEETAYAMSLMLSRQAPIALTGAMRLPSHPGADGPANLRAAAVAAADRRCAPLGPVVVLGDELHLARWVAKVHTTRSAAISSPGLGPVGTVVEDRLELSVDSAPSDFVGMPESLEAQVVELVVMAAGDSGRLIDAATAYADGIVVAGTGGGHVPPPAARAIERAIAAGVPVVRASRTGAGPLLTRTYSGDGGELHLNSLGVVSAGGLAPLKARLRLQVALALGLSAHEAFAAREAAESQL